MTSTTDFNLPADARAAEMQAEISGYKKRAEICKEFYALAESDSENTVLQFHSLVNHHWADLQQMLAAKRIDGLWYYRTALGQYMVAFQQRTVETISQDWRTVDLGN